MFVLRRLNRGRLVARLFGLALTLAVASATAQTTLQITATDPGPSTTLPTGDAFSLRVVYHASTAFRLRVLGQRDGATVAGVTHASPRHGPGTGEAIAWLTFPHPTHLDRVLLAAEDSATGQVLAQKAVPVQLTWSKAAEVPHVDPAAWVLNLNNAAQRAMYTELHPRRVEPPRNWSILPVWLMVLSIPLYLLLQLSLPWFLHDRWRKAAWAPAGAMTPLFAYVLIATYTFKSNQAPLWLLLACPPLCLYLLALLVIHRMKRSRG